jgi:hypothetical protein
LQGNPPTSASQVGAPALIAPTNHKSADAGRVANVPTIHHIQVRRETLTLPLSVAAGDNFTVSSVRRLAAVGQDLTSLDWASVRG